MRILTVVDYDEMWPTLFENERTLLQMTLGKVISRIHHIGSTSVPGLSAKPVIDILIEVANLEELDSLNQAMEGVGYTVRGENGILNRRYFTKGGSQRSHHIHAFTTGDAQIIKHLAFRDYLIKHNDVAIQYALMKKSAMLLCENDSHRYSIYKADFIQKQRFPPDSAILTIGAHNVYYVKCNVVLNNVIFDSCLFPHQHYDRHSFHARECCAIRQNVRGDKSSMAFNNHFAHYSLFSYSKSQGNSFSHTCCLYCPAYLTAVAFSDRTRHGMPDEMLI